MMNLQNVDRQAVEAAAKSLGVQTAALLAVIQVESSGKIGEVINGKLEPIIRYEGHYFDKLCPPSVRDAARKAGVSAKEAGKIKNPASQRDRWALVLKAAQYNASAAYQSCSYGIGQVMGVHWKVLGYTSVDQMVAKARSGFPGQLDLMVRFIRAFDLVEELKTLDWSAFARGYNGPAFAKNKYDVNMEAAYYNNGGLHSIAANRSGTLRLGSSGAGVRDLQALLRVAGLNVNVDGEFGTSTKNAVKAFQTSKGLNPDGVVGPQTQQALGAYRDVSKDKPGQVSLFQKPVVQKAIAFGIGAPAGITGAKNTVQQYVDQLSPYSFLAPITEHLTTIVGVLTVTGIAVTAGVALYQWRQSKKTFTGTYAEDRVVDSELDIDQALVLPPST